MARSNIDGAEIRGSMLGEGNRFLRNIQTLGADLTLAADAPSLQALDPGGAGRVVLLPAERAGAFFIIVNNADNPEDLTVKEDAGVTTIGVVGQNQVGLFFCDGTTWSSTLEAEQDDIDVNSITNDGNLISGSNATDRVTVKGIYHSPAAVVVAVPTIANDAAENVDSVAVDVSGSFSMQPAVGDAVIAIPLEALPTDCLLLGASVTATDQITVVFGSKEGGGGVTGANKNFDFLILDLT